MSKKMKHNKSGINSLAVLELSDKQLESSEVDVCREEEGFFFNSKCKFVNAQDGRVTINGHKYYGYHLIALKRFGR